MWYLIRGVPKEQCETIWSHGIRTCNACIAVIDGTPERVENKLTFPIKWLTHDWVEWDEKDFTPHCGICHEEKKRLEKESLQRLRERLWWDFSRILDITEEYLDWSWRDDKELFYVDKTRAWGWWLNYEALWFTWMDNFHPYTLERLASSKYHTRIYKILLEREFISIDFFTQYFTLLRLAGDYEKFRKQFTQI